MSDESEIAQILAGIGRLKLGKMSTTLLAWIAIMKWRRLTPWQQVSGAILAVFGTIGLGYWHWS